MDGFPATQGAACRIDVTLRDANGAVVTSYDGTQTLAATLGPGGSAPSLCSPAAAWTTPAAGLVRLTVSAAQTAALAPGSYTLQLVLTDAGTPVEAYACRLDVAARPAADGSAPAVGAKPASGAPPALATVYATDEDLAVRAPQDYFTLCPPSNKLAAGSDGVFTTSDPWALASAQCDFLARGVTAGSVVALLRPASAFPNGPELFAVDAVAAGVCWLRRPGRAFGVGQPPAPQGLAGVAFEVRSYGPLIDGASYDANKFFGIDPNFPDRAPAQLYDPRELTQFVVLTALKRAYVAADKLAAGDYALKLGQVAVDLDDLRSRLVVDWGKLKALKPANSVFGSRMRR